MVVAFPGYLHLIVFLISVLASYSQAFFVSNFRISFNFQTNKNLKACLWKQTTQKKDEKSSLFSFSITLLTINNAKREVKKQKIRSE